jgi:site-specific DNA-cytosine methylase
MEGDGYKVAPPLEIPACAFGLNHWRARLWILGYSDSDRESRRAVNAKAPVVQEGHSHARGMGDDDGIPSRMDRLKALGNAVVVPEAEWIGRQIMAVVTK